MSYMYTTMGFCVQFIRRISTACCDIVEYEICGQYHLSRVYSSNKGSYFKVRERNEYYGRCYLF